MPATVQKGGECGCSAKGVDPLSKLLAGKGGKRGSWRLRKRGLTKARRNRSKRPYRGKSPAASRRAFRGGAYEDIASFPGSTNHSTAAMYAFNTNAGGTHDPSSAVNTELSRQEPGSYQY